jgi:GTP-binding protein
LFQLRPLVFQNIWQKSFIRYARSQKVDSNSIPTPKVMKSVATEPGNTYETNFINKMKDMKQMNSPKKIVEAAQIASSTGQFNLNMTKIALRTLQSLNRTDLGPAIFMAYSKSKNDSIDLLSIDLHNEPINTLMVIKWYCKYSNLTMAENICQILGFSLHTDCLISENSKIYQNLNSENEIFRLFYQQFYSDILLQLALGYASMKDHDLQVLQTLSTMVKYGMRINPNNPDKSETVGTITTITTNHNQYIDPAKRLLKQFLKTSTHSSIMLLTKYLLSLECLRDQDSLQLIIQSYMHTINFMKGAVSMETLPPPLYHEIAFVGRSNVGKSSLINALVNRKQLAYTSKTAGKTSEFNYFHLSGNIGKVKEPTNFYLIDLPGVGYAEKSKEKRLNWFHFLQEFVTKRSTLKCIFHLIDTRHGLLDADEDLLALLPTIPETVNYILVFTKVDKFKHPDRYLSRLLTLNQLQEQSITLQNEIPLSNEMIEQVYSKVRKYSIRNLPIIFTSSESKQGVLTVLQVALDGTIVTTNAGQEKLQ